MGTVSTEIIKRFRVLVTKERKKNQKAIEPIVLALTNKSSNNCGRHHRTKIKRGKVRFLFKIKNKRKTIQKDCT